MTEKIIQTTRQIQRSMVRISHEILERNSSVEDLILVGMYSRGVPLAKRLSKTISRFEGTELIVGSLDIGLYRDDFSEKGRSAVKPSNIPVNIKDMSVILVDDVLFTGRSIRAAMDALNDFGRPAQIQLAVLVDRGHRELPIRADYVGKNVPTSRIEDVKVRLTELDGVDEIVITSTA